MTQSRSGGATGQRTTPAATVTTRRQQMKYKVSTSSTSATGISKIRGAKQPYPGEPQIHFTREAWVKQCHIVEKSPKEVGWFALVDFDPDRDVFTIFDLIIPKQEVSSVETDIGKEDLADAAMELIEQGKDTSKMYAWFHSHVNMGVTPSGQDEYQVEDFLEDLADQPEVPAFIRGIQNKKGDLKLDVYYIQHGIAYQNVDFFVIHDDDPQWKVDIENELKAKVSEQRVYSYNNSSYAGKKPANGSAPAAGGRVVHGNQWEVGFRRDPYSYDPYYDHYEFDDRATTQKTLDLDDDDDDQAPEPMDELEGKEKWWDMDTVYTSPNGNDVMADDDGTLYVCTHAGDLYLYDEYEAYYGSVDVTPEDFVEDVVVSA